MNKSEIAEIQRKQAAADRAWAFCEEKCVPNLDIEREGNCKVTLTELLVEFVERAIAESQAPQPGTAENLAKKFHETYERLAPNFGYETRKESAVPWEDVPDKNKQLMIAVCAEISDERKVMPSDTAEPQQRRRESKHSNSAVAGDASAKTRAELGNGEPGPPPPPPSPPNFSAQDFVRNYRIERGWVYQEWSIPQTAEIAEAWAKRLGDTRELKAALKMAVEWEADYRKINNLCGPKLHWVIEAERLLG